MHWLCWAMPVAAYSSFQRSSPQYFSCFPGPSAGRQEPVRHASSSGDEWCRDMFFQGCPCGAWCYVVGEQEMAQLLRGRSTSSAHLETETDCNISSSCSVQQQLQHWWRKGSITFHFLHLQQWDNHVQLLLSDGRTLGLLSKVQPLPWHRAGGGCRTGWTYLTRGKWWFARLLSSSKEKHLRCLRAGLLSKWQTSGNLIKFNKD